MKLYFFPEKKMCAPTQTHYPKHTIFLFFLGGGGGGGYRKSCMFNEMLDVFLDDLNQEDINVYKRIHLFILKDRSVTVPD